MGSLYVCTSVAITVLLCRDLYFVIGKDFCGLFLTDHQVESLSHAPLLKISCSEKLTMKSATCSQLYINLYNYIRSFI